MAGHDNYFFTNEIREYQNVQAKNSKTTTTWYPPIDYPIGLTLFDYDFHNGLRVKSYFDKVKYNETSQAFDATINLDSWGDTTMYATQCTWLDTHKHDREFQHGKLTLKPDQLTQTISFPTDFATPPAVIVWLSGFDVASTGDWRFSVDVRNATTKGCEIYGAAWGNCQLNSIEATWIAYPGSRPNIDYGRFDTLDVRPDYKQSQHEHKMDIVFNRKFARVPKVYFALNKIDSNHVHNLRLKASITDTTAKGTTLHLDSWYEFNMYSSSGQWIAIQDY